MSLSLAFALLGGLLVLAFAANRLFRLTRIPDVVVLVGAGVLLGPVLGWLQPSQFQPAARALGTLALILILFEGGLDLDLRDTLRHFPGGILLSFFSYTFSVAAVALVIRWSMGLSPASALLVGSVLGCTSSSVTLPVLQQIEASTPARITLLLDASLSDTFAVVTVSVLLGL
ncbi:MAG TPA: cation:proton antiporter, partial [Terriglobia bacterium]|nr:cation:proton antiporter [Terriglobia bacterium]